MANVKTAKELGKAIKKGEDIIEIEGDLVKKVVRIRATGKIAWAIAISAIGVVVYSILAAPETAGTSITLNFMAIPTTVGILGGISVTEVAIFIAVAGGSVGTLNTLRGYKEISRTKNKLVLKKK